MIELKKTTAVPGLVFDVMVAGAEDAPLVLLLHGFAESFHMWRGQMPALAAAGYRAVAPSQRGYSAGARPDTRARELQVRSSPKRCAQYRGRLRQRRSALSPSRP